MKQFLKILAVLATLLPVCARTFAQTDEEIRNHTIIVIDERIVGWKPGDNDIRDKVLDYLFNPIVVNGRTLYEGRPLYGQGDFLSVVTFSLSAADESADAFTGIANYGDLRYKFVPYSEEVRAVLEEHWSELARKRFLPGERHSIFSIAIPHAMRRCCREEDGQLANRTFVLMITDRSYSDKDYFDDIRDFTDSQWSYSGGHSIGKIDLLGISQSVSKDYFINWINQDEKRYQFWTTYHLRKKNVDLYELQPLQEHLKMSAVVRYPEKIIAKRGRWGKYTATLTVQPEDSVRFNVLRMTATLQGKGMEEEPLSYRSDSPSVSFGGEGKTFTLGKRRRNDSRIELRVWANLKDGFYNATVLTPSKDGDASLGKDGLNVTIPIEYEKRAMIFFGLLPLWGVFCFTENQYVAAMLLNFIIIFLALASLAFYLWKNRYFEPSIDEISIDYKNRYDNDNN